MLAAARQLGYAPNSTARSLGTPIRVTVARSRPTAAGIANAVRDALGVPVRDPSPTHRGRVIDALG